MTAQFVLLTGAMAAPFLRDYLVSRDPGCEVHIATNQAELEAVASARSDLRLIAFLTSTIVPQHILDRLDLEPYNIHPGPPEFPGVYPEVFAIWEDAPDFGVTAHVIEPRVDSGPIVFVERFAMPHGIERQALADRAFLCAINAFRYVADHCAMTDAPIPKACEQWSGTLRTRAAFAELCARDPKSSNPGRLSRACGADLPQKGSAYPTHSAV